ncbi:TauD/TfdA dioxygenase family protein [Protofrankia symbiont of Coriaria ruscifolia]|uniref:TauD/TfdA dioxygenase family protein n=1 Tax=Protofrankia symbiont of Coriaria ruscifolia TaxID=1306542 RepID=UPI001040EB4E|nr:TauD/TfdA family dioxygenase [Protofrankia symbiont of Coriaria ruscifolia]
MTIISGPPTTIGNRRLAGHIGAEISGVDISGSLDDQVVAEIRQALLTYKVIFFRGQRLGHDEQIAFARRFGQTTRAHPHEDAPPERHPEILTVDPRKYEEMYGTDYQEQINSQRHFTYFAGWHTDLTAAVNPPAASVLRAEIVPEFGGDTTWTNLVAAYEGLSAPLRGFVDQLRAEHRFRAALPVDDEEGQAARARSAPLVAIHPVVRVHPETGERALFVNPNFTTRILQLDPGESRRILELLFEEIARPDYTVRFHWEPGSVAFWDNRATAHLGPTDLSRLPVERVLHRVTLIGDVPVGPDGFTSQLVAGHPFTAD